MAINIILATTVVPKLTGLGLYSWKRQEGSEGDGETLVHFVYVYLIIYMSFIIKKKVRVMEIHHSRQEMRTANAKQ